MKKLSIALSLIIALQYGCGMKKMATKVIGSISTDGMVSVEQDDDVAFTRDSLPALIKTLEVLSYGNPKDARTLALLAKAYGTYSFGFLEEDLLKTPEKDSRHEQAASRVAGFYERGKGFGILALSTNSSMKKAFEGPFDAFRKAVSSLGKKQVPAMFWTAFNWAGWINLHKDDPSAVADVPRVQALIERVLELAPDYYFGSAHAIRGVMAASRPKMLGGDLALAQKEFDEAMKAAPNYLMTKVIYAQYYARQAGDSSLFRKELKEVQGADAAALPAQRLSNELAKRRAEILLSQEKSFF